MKVEERNKKVEENINLIYLVINRKFKKLSRGGNHFFTEDDLFQEGYFGLARAVEQFDESKGFAFSTFACKMIEYAILRYVVTKNNMMKFPKALVEKVQKYASKTDEEINNYRDVMRIFDCSEKEAHYIFGFFINSKGRSIHKPIKRPDNETETVEDTIGFVDEGFYRAELRADIDKFVSTLSEDHQTILRMTLEDKTVNEIGQALGIWYSSVGHAMRKTIRRKAKMARMEELIK